MKTKIDIYSYINNRSVNILCLSLLLLKLIRMSCNICGVLKKRDTHCSPCATKAGYVVQHSSVIKCIRKRRKQMFDEKSGLPIYPDTVIQKNESVVITYGGGGGTKEEIKCVICLDCEDGPVTYNAPCGHKFHVDCLKGGGGGIVITKCPLCSKPIPEMRRFARVHNLEEVGAYREDTSADVRLVNDLMVQDAPIVADDLVDSTQVQILWDLTHFLHTS